MRKRPILPRFNSTFRYTGTYTYHQARQLLPDRPNPDFDRSLSKRMTKSLDVCKYWLFSIIFFSFFNIIFFPVDKSNSGEIFENKKIFASCFVKLTCYFYKSNKNKFYLYLFLAGGDTQRPSRPVLQRPLPRPQSVEPFFETHRIPIYDVCYSFFSITSYLFIFYRNRVVKEVIGMMISMNLRAIWKKVLCWSLIECFV
jgi:hypothetical protein